MTELVIGLVVVLLVGIAVVLIGLPLLLWVFMLGIRWLTFVNDRLHIVRPW